MFSEIRRTLHDVFGWHKMEVQAPPVWAVGGRCTYLKCRYCTWVRFRGVWK